MTDAALTESDIQREVQALGQLREAIGQAIVGQAEVVEQLLIGLLAGGHCLLEGVPGLGKTLLVRSLGQALDLQFRRIQFTPDLMPSDIIGTEILEEDHGTGRRMFKFQKGPVFTNLLLADELNRTPPKTQAALLEAMQEHTVSYGGITHPLPSPFFVLATQNPLEQAGTYPLPEAQLDRFLLHIRVPYPSEAEEHAILARTTGSAEAQVPQVLDGAALLRLQRHVRDVHVGDALLAWINRLVRSTRPAEAASDDVRNWVRWGAGPRAGQSLVLASKARALMHGRFAATREDVAALAAPVMRHRILLSFAAEAERISADDVIAGMVPMQACSAAVASSSRSTAPTNPATIHARSTGSCTPVPTATTCAKPSAKARWWRGSYWTRAHRWGKPTRRGQRFPGSTSPGKWLRARCRLPCRAVIASACWRSTKNSSTPSRRAQALAIVIAACWQWTPSRQMHAGRTPRAWPPRGSGSVRAAWCCCSATASTMLRSRWRRNSRLPAARYAWSSC